MKKLILAISFMVGISVVANAQNPSKKEMNKTHTIEMKDHVCTDACHTSGDCVYAHGEKGHVCTDECKTMSTTKATSMDMKDHVCTTACKDGKHAFAHGEKGHVCTAECMKNK